MSRRVSLQPTTLSLDVAIARDLERSVFVPPCVIHVNVERLWLLQRSNEIHLWDDSPWIFGQSRQAIVSRFFWSGLQISRLTLRDSSSSAVWLHFDRFIESRASHSSSFADSCDVDVWIIVSPNFLCALHKNRLLWCICWPCSVAVFSHRSEHCPPGIVFPFNSLRPFSVAAMS